MVEEGVYFVLLYYADGSYANFTPMYLFIKLKLLALNILLSRSTLVIKGSLQASIPGKNSPNLGVSHHLMVHLSSASHIWLAHYAVLSHRAGTNFTPIMC